MVDYESFNVQEYEKFMCSQQYGRPISIDLERRLRNSDDQYHNINRECSKRDESCDYYISIYDRSLCLWNFDLFQANKK